MSSAPLDAATFSPLQPVEMLLPIPAVLDFGPGPFRELAPPQVALREARHRFMYSVCVVAPWITVTLFQYVLGYYVDAFAKAGMWDMAFLKAWEARTQPKGEHPSILELPLVKLRDKLHFSDWETLDNDCDHMPGVGDVWACLYAIADDCHLRDAWCLDWMLRQLFRFLVHLMEVSLEGAGQDEEGYYLSTGVTFSAHPPDEREPDLPDVEWPRPDDPLWRVDSEDMGTARRRIIATLQKRADAGLNQILKDLQAQGWQKVKVHPNARHFAWLVHYQCGGYSFNQIARENFCQRQSVAGPATELARSIGLTLRKSPPGRPKGAKDKHPKARRRAR